MREHYLPEKWIELAKETMKSHVNKEELERFLRKAEEERSQVKEVN